MQGAQGKYFKTENWLELGKACDPLFTVVIQQGEDLEASLERQTLLVFFSLLISESFI